MAQKKLTQLPKTQFSGLEFSNIMNDVFSMIRESPNYNENWDDFLAGDAGVMLTEVFAWITDQLATRIDWVVNENFIGTATQKKSIINLLKLIGYKFNLPNASAVTVSISFGEDNEDYYLTQSYDPSIGTFKPKTLIAINKKGQTKYFEAIEFDELSKEFNYKLPVYVDTTYSLKHDVVFYEGQTKIENFISTSGQGQKYVLAESPVIRNSVKVYLVEYNGGTGTTTEKELLEVDNFLSSESQKEINDDGTENAIPYIVNVLENDTVEVAFGPSSLLASSTRRLPEGSSIRVFYRVGGGVDGDIQKGAIDEQEDIVNNGVSTYVKYKNLTEGTGGEDSESIEHAAYAGPLKITTVGKTVTEDDYDIVISNFTNILLSKSYGHNNLPSNFYDLYGYFPSPNEVLNFITMKKPGWEDIPPSKYNLANWGTLNLENYFNEPLTFTDGEFGKEMDLNKNIDHSLILEQHYDNNNGAGGIFYNFKILRTPQGWKDNIYIEDPENPGNYIANKEAKASITYTEYNPEIHLKLEDLTDHFVANEEETDPYFYGDYNGTGAAREELEENIHAYFQSEKNNISGVYIGDGTENDRKNLITLNIDGHGDVQIDLSVNGIMSGTVPLDGTNGIIDTINSSLASAYNDIMSYQDFGVLIPDTTQEIPKLSGKVDEDWILRVSGVDYTINTGDNLSYDNNLIQINLGLGAYGSQKFAYSSSNWTVVDGTAYDFNIKIDGASSSTLITLEAVSGTELGAGELIEMINNQFESLGLEAFAVIDSVTTFPTVKVASKSTGNDSSIEITSGDNNDLLAITGAMQTAENGGNIEAFFVPSLVNVACKDVRVSRTNTTSGGIELAFSGTSTDILDAYDALPLTTSPVDNGDYSNVASIFTRTGDSIRSYVKLTSPNTGSNSKISIIEPSIGTERDATEEVFGLKFSDYGTTTLNNYGQRRLTIITADTEQDDFGDFIYEHGSLIINEEEPEFVYLNYLKSTRDTIRLGSYYSDNFDEIDPEWKHPLTRLYNTEYKLAGTAENPLNEEIDYETSDFLLKFTRNKIVSNSLFTIDSSINLEKMSPPTITSIDLSTFPDTTGKFLQISINKNNYKKVDISSVNDIDELVTVLNNNWGTEAREKELGEEVVFAVKDEDTIVLSIADNTRTGSITIYDGVDLLGATLFNTTSGEDTKILPTGDYYLEHYVPEESTELTPEERFGYFTINIIDGVSENIPDLSFMSHMINDRRHEFLDENVYDIRTDEDNLKEHLYPYKIVGIENVFLTPVFLTFDLEAEIFIDAKVSLEQAKSSVLDKFQEIYCLKNSQLGKDINKSEIVGNILSLEGVRFMDISYFGEDYSNQTEKPNKEFKISVDFDKICVLSDDRYDDRGNQTNGLLLKFTSL